MVDAGSHLLAARHTERCLEPTVMPLQVDEPRHVEPLQIHHRGGARLLQEVRKRRHVHHAGAIAQIRHDARLLEGQVILLRHAIEVAVKHALRPIHAEEWVRLRAGRHVAGHPFPAQLRRAGHAADRRIVGGERHEVTVDVGAAPLVFVFVEHAAVEVPVIAEHSALHAHHVRQVGARNERAFGLDVVVDRRAQHRHRAHVQHVFEVEDEILAPVEGLVHAHAMVADDACAIQLVPDDAVIEVGWVLHHEVGVFLPAEAGRVPADLPFARHVVAHHAVEVGDHHVGVVFERGSHEQFRGVLGDPIVGVEELDVCAFCLAEGEVAGGGDAGVGFVDDGHALVGGGVGVEDCGRAVGAAVVDEQQFEIREFLPQYGIDAAAYAFLGIVDRHDDADGRLMHGGFLSMD